MTSMPRRRSGGLSGDAFGLIPDDFPLVSAVLVGLSVLMYFITVKVTGDATGESVLEPAPVILVRYGATFSPLVERGEWWRFFSSIFLHGSPMHILMNSLGLWVVGNAAEQRFGRARALAVFVLSGAFGMATSYWWRDLANVVGASGGIFGLMGMVIAHSLRHRSLASAELRARFVPWLIYSVILGFAVPGIDNAAHIGGLAAGALCGLFVSDSGVVKRVPFVWEATAVAAMGCVAAAFVLALRSGAMLGL